MVKVCIDAGHNDAGYDTGAAGNGLREQDITFIIAHEVARLLRNQRVDTIETRPTKATSLGYDEDSSLRERVRISDSNNCTLFVSIHCNSNTGVPGTGTECRVSSIAGNGAKAAKLVQHRICNDLQMASRSLKVQNVYVIKKTKCSAFLVETAFINNTLDSVKLRYKHKEFAKAIFEGIMEYLGMSINETIPATTSRKEGTTHIVEIDPRNIFTIATGKRTYDTDEENFVNGIFFINQRVGGPAANGIMVNAGVVLANSATHGLPVSTLMIKGPSDVTVKRIVDITQEQNVWMAISGFGLYPQLTAAEEGFRKCVENGVAKDYSDVLRVCDRPIIGYRAQDNKVVIAVRPATSALRAAETARNLGLDYAISLDAGGSTTLTINGEKIFRGDGRVLFGGVTWRG